MHMNVYKSKCISIIFNQHNLCSVLKEDLTTFSVVGAVKLHLLVLFLFGSETVIIFHFGTFGNILNPRYAQSCSNGPGDIVPSSTK